MPPDDLPAGSCPECGKTYCIGCAKEHLDESGRFLCSECGKSLKLIDEGLKKLVYDWASKEIPAEPAAAEPTPAEPMPPESAPAEPTPAEPAPTAESVSAAEPVETQSVEPAPAESAPAGTVAPLNGC
jgi:hypothetical protein